MVSPYSNPGPQGTRHVHPGVYNVGSEGGTAVGAPATGAASFPVDTSGITGLQSAVRNLTTEFDKLNTKIESVLGNLTAVGQAKIGGTAPTGAGSNLTAAPITMVAGADIAAGYAGAINQRMGALQAGGIPIQQMAQQAAQFGGRSLTTTVAGFTGRANLGMGDLGQAMAMQQANPVLSLMVPGMRGYNNYQGFLNGLAKMNPAGGASWAQGFANALTSPAMSQFFQQRGQTAGLFNAQTGGLNPAPQVMRSLVDAIMMRNVSGRQAQNLASSPRFRIQLSNLISTGQLPIDPSMQTALLSYMGTGMNWQKTQQVMGTTVAQSQMNKLTAQTGAGMQIFQDTTQLQNTVNNLSADFSKAVKATAVLTPGLFVLSGALAYATKMILGAGSQIAALSVMLKSAGLGGGGIGGMGFPGVSPAGEAGLGGEAALAGSTATATAGPLGSRMLGRLFGAGGLGRVMGAERASAASAGLESILGRGMLGGLFGGKGLAGGGLKGFGVGMGTSILGQMLGSWLESKGTGTGFGAEAATFGGGMAKGAGLGFAIGGLPGLAIGAGVGGIDAELQKHFFSHWQQSSNPFLSTIGGIGSGIGSLLGLGDPVTGSQTTSGMQPNLAHGITAMQRVNPKIRINSGFRSQSQQGALYSMKGGHGVARPGQSPHQLGKAADIGPPSQFGWIAQNAGLFGLGTAKGEPWHVQAMGDPSSPVSGLATGRVDQGVDFSGKGTVNAVGDGTIIYVTNSGWGSLGNAGLGALIALKLDNPPDPQHSVVYYAESIIPSVRVGQHVTAGQVLGTCPGGGSSIEIGWADPTNPRNPLAPLDMAHTGAATAEGQNFLKWITGAAPSSGGTAAQSAGAGAGTAASTGGGGVVPGSAIGLTSSFIAGLSSFQPFGGISTSAAALPASTAGGTKQSQQGTTSATGTGTAQPTGPAPTGTLTASQVYKLALGAGLSPAAARLATAVAKVESNFLTTATDHNTNNTTDYGLWQINSQYGGSSALFDSQAAAKNMAQITSNGTNWARWGPDFGESGWSTNPPAGGLPGSKIATALSSLGTLGDPGGALFTGQGAPGGGGPRMLVGGTGRGGGVNVTVGPIYVQGTQADANNIANMIASAIRSNQNIQAVGMS